MQQEEIIWPFPDKPAREVQMRALAKGYGKYGFAYFMRQRLGKTLTAYAEYTLLREKGLVDWFILICKNDLKDQLRDAILEVDEYTPICTYESQNKARSDWYFEHNKKGGVFIINYESIKAFMDDQGWTKFNPLRTYLVADESTKIKEPTAKMTKAAHELSSLCAYTRILTGKPTGNSNTDMWSQLKFIKATQRNFTQHKYYFSIVGGFQGRQSVGNINTEFLQREMEPHCYIAEDKYIKGFEKIYEPMRAVNLTGEQLASYKRMQDDLIMELSDGTEITAPIALVKYLRLQQISSGIAGDPDGVQHNIVDPALNPRIRVVKELIETEIDHKVIIPCRFTLSVDNLYKELTKDGYKCARMYGKALMAKHELDIEDQKRKFNEQDYDVMIAQIGVLAYGHTLCATDEYPCDSMIFYENNFSLLDRSQCESRPEKYERQKPISYYDLFSSKMDKYILQALIRKEDASMALMGYAREYGIRPYG